MRTREIRKRETRARLIRAAFTLFADQGISATRTLEVARRAGVSHGTVFAHFRKRDALIAAVIGEYSKRVIERIHTLVEQGAGVREVLEAHLAGLSEYETFYARLVSEGPTLPPCARTTLLGIQSAISYHLSVAAQAQMQASAIKRMPIHLLFNTWLGLVHHYLMNRDLFAPGKSVLSARGEELISHFLALLKPK